MGEAAPGTMGIEFAAALAGTGAALFSGGAAVLWMCSRMVARVETASRAEHLALAESISATRTDLERSIAAGRTDMERLIGEVRADVAGLTAKVDILLEDRGLAKRGGGSSGPGPVTHG